MLCEKCHIEHDGKYGSGRFCDAKCARSFSTSRDRENITKKMRQTLVVSRPPTLSHLQCLQCNSFFVAPTGRKRKFCSLSCGSLFNMNKPEMRSICSDRAAKRIELHGSWYGRKSVYKFHEASIRCDSILELTCLTWFCREHCVKNIERSNIWLTYIHNGKSHRYNPDFMITTGTSTFLVEVMSKRHGKNDVWQDYLERKVDKINVLNEYCERNNYKMFIFDQHIDTSLYRSLLSA